MTKQQKSKYCCQACGREIVNRAVDRCLYCGESIPKDLQFTEEEIQVNEEAYKEKIREIEDGRKRKKRNSIEGSGGPFDSGWGDC